MKRFVKKFLSLMKLQIRRYPDAQQDRRMLILDYFAIDMILDIGANTGQYAMFMRDLGYSNRIISFEPLTEAFQLLLVKSKNDPSWEAFNFALGDSNYETTINISENSQSSSISEILPTHLQAAPASNYVSSEPISVITLDSKFAEFCKDASSVLMKIDTQGFEEKVLIGAANSLKKIRIIQLEMSIVQLYRSELTFVPMLNFMQQNGYVLYSLEPGFYNKKSGQLLQVDGIFVQQSLMESL